VKNERLYLGHIREAINDIRAYASVGEEAFLADRMRQDAIIRKLEIIGEAVKQLSEATKAQRPEIPWKQIAGMRDRLTHAYFGVDLGLVWRVVERDLQALETAIGVLIETPGTADRSRGSA
jgi:uncharacterized protein with HEPN domain